MFVTGGGRIGDNKKKRDGFENLGEIAEKLEKDLMAHIRDTKDKLKKKISAEEAEKHNLHRSKTLLKKKQVQLERDQTRLNSQQQAQEEQQTALDSGQGVCNTEGGGDEVETRREEA